MVTLGSGSQRQVNDYRLSRYACYLIAQNQEIPSPVNAIPKSNRLFELPPAEKPDNTDQD